MTSRERRPILIGKPSKRSAKLLKCWRASRVVGQTTATCMPGHRRDEGGAQRDLGLAEADIADDQPVHRLARGEIVEHVVDRAILIVGFLDRGSDRRSRDSRCRRARATSAGRSARSAAVAISSPAISRMRSFIRALRRCHASPPSLSSATPSLVRAVARQDVEILDRHVELVAAGIGQRDAVVRALPTGIEVSPS